MADKRREVQQRAHARAEEERSRRAWERTMSPEGRNDWFTCPGCGLWYPARRAVDPGALPRMCLCCHLVSTVNNAPLRETLRRLIDWDGTRFRCGGRTDPPPAGSWWR